MLNFILAILMMAVVSSRKTYLTKVEHNLTQPHVRATYDCTFCYYRTDTDNCCVDYQMRMDIGW